MTAFALDMDAAPDGAFAHHHEVLDLAPAPVRAARATSSWAAGSDSLACPCASGTSVSRRVSLGCEPLGSPFGPIGELALESVAWDA
jgi:hypothetical protein